MYRLLLILFVLSSCTKEEFNPTPCMGDCETAYKVIYKNQLIYTNNNGYYEIEWDSLHYFQISGYLTPLNDEYVLNGTPLVEARFDSDYWIVLDTLTFQTPMELNFYHTEEHFSKIKTPQKMRYPFRLLISL